MKRKPVTRRNILNDILVLIIVITVALVVMLKDRGDDSSHEGRAAEIQSGYEEDQE